MSRERFTIRLETDDPRHARVLNALHSIPVGRRGEYAVQLILQALDQEETVYCAVKRALAEYQPLLQTPPNHTQIQAGSVSDDMLGFIFALQNGEMI